MKKLIEKLKSYDDKLIKWERNHPFISHLLKVILFIIRAFLISALICMCVDSIYSDSLSISTIIGFAFLVYFILGDSIDNLIYTEDVLENHLLRIERLEEKTDLLETQQDCIEKWYLNDDLYLARIDSCSRRRAREETCLCRLVITPADDNEHNILAKNKTRWRRRN